MKKWMNVLLGSNGQSNVGLWTTHSSSAKGVLPILGDNHLSLNWVIRDKIITCVLLLVDYQGVSLYTCVLVVTVREAHVENFAYGQLATQRGWVTRQVTQDSRFAIQCQRASLFDPYWAETAKGTDSWGPIIRPNWVGETNKGEFLQARVWNRLFSRHLT